MLTNAGRCCASAVELGQRGSATEYFAQCCVIVSEAVVVQRFQEIDKAQVVIDETAVGQRPGVFFQLPGKIDQFTQLTVQSGQRLGFVQEGFVIGDEVEYDQAIFAFRVT